MTEFFEAIRDFTETGGQVLLVIGLLIFVMWMLILERVLYVFIWHKAKKRSAMQEWLARSDKSSWNAEQVRQKIISRLIMNLMRIKSIIKDVKSTSFGSGNPGFPLFITYSNHENQAGSNSAKTHCSSTLKIAFNFVFRHHSHTIPYFS